MSILSGPEIHEQIELGHIAIEPFCPSHLGPNSYDVCLGKYLLCVCDPIFDISVEPNLIETIEIPEQGFVLEPGLGYLGHTVEKITCHGFVPWIDGRSTTGRHFLQCHQTAGRGDDGFSGTFTLELLAAYRPVRIYSGMPIAQISFFTLKGRRNPYNGRYINQHLPTLPKPIRIKNGYEED